MRTQRISGVETLSRWNHPERGSVSPVEFNPIAEQSGLIRGIGDWVLRTACREAARWAGGGAESYVSVNVSARRSVSCSLTESSLRRETADAQSVGRIA